MRFHFWFLILSLTSFLYLGNSQILLADTLEFSFQRDRAILISEMQSENVPEKVLNSVRQEISKRDRLDANTLKVVKAMQQTWSDGCLELAKPDELCTQALVEGWRVVMNDGKKSWIYRTDATGHFLRLEIEQ